MWFGSRLVEAWFDRAFPVRSIYPIVAARPARELLWQTGHIHTGLSFLLHFRYTLVTCISVALLLHFCCNSVAILLHFRRTSVYYLFELFHHRYRSEQTTMIIG
jgi:hypothetical protein